MNKVDRAAENERFHQVKDVRALYDKDVEEILEAVRDTHCLILAGHSMSERGVLEGFSRILSSEASRRSHEELILGLGRTP